MGVRKYDQSHGRGPVRSESISLDESANGKPAKHAVTHIGYGPTSYESYLPQSADDMAIRQRTKNILDQVELHVENFYQNAQNPDSRSTDKELALFNSPQLLEPLPSLLEYSADKVSPIKHALAHLVTSSISMNAKPTESLLPAELLALPNSLALTKPAAQTKPGKESECPSK